MSDSTIRHRPITWQSNGPLTARSAEAGLPLARHSLDPAERLFDALTDTLAHPITRVSGCTPVNGRAPPARVLRHMRRHPDRSQLIHEVLCVIALVSAERDRAGAVGMRRDEGQS